MSVSQRAAMLGLPAGLIRTALGKSSGTEAYSKKLFGGSGGNNPGAQRRIAKERAASRTLKTLERMKRQGKVGGDAGGGGSSNLVSGRFVGGQ